MRALCSILAIAMLLVSSMATHAQFNPRYAGDQTWRSDHISALPKEMKARVLSYRKECGLPFAATHEIARPTYYRAPVVALHYESLWCQSRGGGLCKGGSCLHEVYVRDGTRFRITFRGYAKEVDVTTDGKVRIINSGG